jgi:hypothetical protein
MVITVRVGNHVSESSALPFENIIARQERAQCHGHEAFPVQNGLREVSQGPSFTHE